MILAQVKYDKKHPLNMISLVNKGANKEKLVKLADETPTLKLSTNNELMEVTGVVLIPNQLIYRNEEFFDKVLGLKEDGNIFFSKEDIKSFALDYLKNANNSFNLQHETNVPDNAVELVESWIITTENDKAYDMGFDSSRVINGTWMMTQKINDPTIWQEIKDGKYNGFSVEGSPIIEAIMTDIQMGRQFSEDEIADEIVKIIIDYNNN